MAAESESPAASPEPAGAIARLVRAIELAVAALSKAALWVSALLLMSIFALITYSVGMRYFAGQPQPWIDEVAGWLLVGSVMLAIPEVQRRGDHIGIDFVTGMLGPRGRRALLAFGVLTVLASAAIFVREGLAMVEFSRMVGVLSNRIPEVPLWMVQGVVPLGFSLIALVALVQLACFALGLKPRDMSESLKEDV
jgi:TRAP-type C4-dicarboxylate transport system permease small subunit